MEFEQIKCVCIEMYGAKINNILETSKKKHKKNSEAVGVLRRIMTISQSFE